MDFKLSEDERLLEDMVRDFVAREYGFEARRAIKESPEGWSRSLWRQFGELGLLGIGIPEEHGGLDAGPLATMLVMNAFGAGLVLEPYLSSAVVATALLDAASDSAHQARLFPRLGAGETIVVLAHAEPGARGDPGRVATRAARRADGYILTGHKCVIADAPAADELIVSARVSAPGRDESAAELALFCVPRETAGLVLESYANLDGRRAADVRMQEVKVPIEARLRLGNSAEETLERAEGVGVAAVCAEAVGAMASLLETTAEYLRTRRQFGRPIGRFQALQHRAADMLIMTEQARSMSYLASMRCLDADLHERRRALSAAKVLVGRACRFVGQQAVQLHGGMGVTDELSVSHYFKRLTAIELEFGGTERHLERFIETSKSDGAAAVAERANADAQIAG